MHLLRVFADCHLCAPFDDANALAKLAQCAAVTTEFENVNAQAMRDLAQHTRVSPSGNCVAIAQNRIVENRGFAKQVCRLHLIKLLKN